MLGLLCCPLQIELSICPQLLAQAEISSSNTQGGEVVGGPWPWFVTLPCLGLSMGCHHLALLRLWELFQFSEGHPVVTYSF